MHYPQQTTSKARSATDCQMQTIPKRWSCRLVRREFSQKRWSCRLVRREFSQTVVVQIGPSGIFTKTVVVQIGPSGIFTKNPKPGAVQTSKREPFPTRGACLSRPGVLLAPANLRLCSAACFDNGIVAAQTKSELLIFL